MVEDENGFRPARDLLDITARWTILREFNDNSEKEME
jgi:hypothetical protein